MIISSIYIDAGFKVGRFTSPHLHSYLERFAINGNQIGVERFAYYIDEIGRIINQLDKAGLPRPTEFEILTAIAFRFFKDYEVELAVIETGLGGLYDSTNTVNPAVSIITSVDYDHTSFLGNSLQEIALNKAGIIKPGVPVIVGPMEPPALRVIEEEAHKKQSAVYHSSRVRIKRAGFNGIAEQLVDIGHKHLTLRKQPLLLLGDFQLDNLAVALTAVVVMENMGYKVSSEAISRTLSSLRFPGRMEIAKNNPTVILDAAHNPHAARAVAASLRNLYPGIEKILVCGFLDDKDVENIIRPLGANTRACIITKPSSPRSKGWKRALKIWNHLYPDKESYEEEDIAKAIRKGFSILGKDEYLLITGSFYVLDRARRYLLS